jgi:hypothetical protein
VKEARRLARAAVGRVAAGGDPVVKRKEERASATIAALLNRHDEYLKQRGYVNRTDVLESLRRHLTLLGRREISEVRAWELAEILKKLERDGP